MSLTPRAPHPPQAPWKTEGGKFECWLDIALWQAEKSILKGKKAAAAPAANQRGKKGGGRGKGGQGAAKWDNFKKDVGKLQIEIDSETELAL